jgi:YHS domain-containing protein
VADPLREKVEGEMTEVSIKIDDKEYYVSSTKSDLSFDETIEMVGDVLRGVGFRDDLVNETLGEA